MNPELIYPQKPYPHPNTAIAMDKMFLCVPAGKEKEAADTLDKVLFELCGQMKNAFARSDA